MRRASPDVRAVDRAGLALESARLAWWDQDFTTGRVHRSRHWAEMLGYDPDDVDGRLDAWLELVHPDDRETVAEVARAHEAAEIPAFEVEHRLRTAAGGWRWVHNWGRVVERDEDGRPLRAVGVHLDVTRRKQSELERERLIRELERAAAQIRPLRGLIPICAHCKRIRDDQGCWKQLEVYIRDHSDAEFSHGLCPRCVDQLYPEHRDRP